MATSPRGAWLPVLKLRTAYLVSQFITSGSRESSVWSTNRHSCAEVLRRHPVHDADVVVRHGKSLRSAGRLPSRGERLAEPTGP